MPDPSSAISWLWPARLRPAPARPARYRVSREGISIAGHFRRPARTGEQTRPDWTCLWTYYARWEWALSSARTNRARRKTRPTWP